MKQDSADAVDSCRCKRCMQELPSRQVGGAASAVLSEKPMATCLVQAGEAFSSSARVDTTRGRIQYVRNGSRSRIGGACFDNCREQLAR